MCLIFCKTILQSLDMVYTGLFSECEEYLIRYHIWNFYSKTEVLSDMMPCKLVNSYQGSEVAGCLRTSVTTYWLTQIIQEVLQVQQDLCENHEFALCSNFACAIGIFSLKYLCSFTRLILKRIRRSSLEVDMAWRWESGVRCRTQNWRIRWVSALIWCLSLNTVVFTV